MNSYYVFRCASFVLVDGPMTRDGSLLGHKGGPTLSDVDHAFFRVDQDLAPPDRLSTPWGVALTPRAIEVIRGFRLGPELKILETTLLGPHGEDLGLYELIYATKDLHVTDRTKTVYTPIPGTDLAREIKHWVIDESRVPDVDLFREHLSSGWICTSRLAEAFHASGLTNCQFDLIWPTTGAPRLVIPTPVRARRLKVASSSAKRVGTAYDLASKKDWRSLLRRSWDALSPWAAPDRRLHIAAAADERTVEAIEGTIGRKLPGPLKDFFLHGSAQVQVSWTMSERKLAELPGEIGEWAWGEFDLELAEVPSLFEEWSGWTATFDDPDYFPGGLQPPFEHEQLFPLFFTSNGDAIVLVSEGSSAGSVFYIDHEGGNLNWAKLGASITEFLDAWARIGCIGPSEALGFFYDQNVGELSDPRGVARTWIDLVGLHPSGGADP